MSALSRLSLVLSASTVASCGGGGAGTTPPPSAIPPPAISPAPVTPNSSFPSQTDAKTFHSQHSRIVFRQTRSGDFEILHHDYFVDGRGILTPATTVSFDPETGTYAIEGIGGAAEFAITDKNTRYDDIANYGGSSPVVKFDTYSAPSPEDKSKPYEEDILLLYTGKIPRPTVGRVDDVELTYTKLAIWKHRVVGMIGGPADTNGNIEQRSFSIFGFETAQADIPVSGTASYDTFAIGTLVEPGAKPGRSLTDLNGQVSFTVNFNEKTVATRLDLTRWTTTNGDFSFGSLSGTGEFGGANVFSGTLTGIGTLAEYEGRFVGEFFGPAAKEMGYTFSASQPGSSIAGAVIGVKR